MIMRHRVAPFEGCLRGVRAGRSVGKLPMRREISRATPTIPIVLCTMFATAALERESQKFGIRAVVDKSNAGTQLVGVVEEVLNNKV